jgi:LuxR family maltose regulon positive regulatory protein
MKSTINLAKLTRPKLFRAVPRERLFEKLDEACAQQAAWIGSPPGAGKTTLVSSYLECRQLPALWYQIDSGDADPASFFYFLAAAVETLTDNAQLPLLAPEYLSDLSGFTRRFFRELFRCLPRPYALVFDNYHAVPQTSVLHGIICEAVQEVPDGVSMIVTSRHEPPKALLRLQLSRALICLNSRDLRIDADEARAIAAIEGLDAATAQDTRSLWEMSDGWAAGFVLMLEHYRSTGSAGSVSAPSSRQTLFNYFAVEIFAAASADAQHLLVRTAFLPLITAAAAVAISGDLDAGKHLEELYRMRYFIDRRDEQEVTYQYHALFREFLLNQARAHLSAAEYLMLQRRSARLLEMDKRPEEAFLLYVDAREWSAAAQLVRQQAPDLIQQGRWQTVIAWIGALPEDMLDADPWLLYWRGVCEISTCPVRARTALEAAYDGLCARNDRIGQVMTVSAILETYYFEWTSFHPLDRWIDVLVPLLAGDVALPSVAIELRARSGLLAALLYRQPQHPLLPQETARTLALLESDIPTASQCAAATILLNCYCFVGNLDGAERVVGLLRGSLENAQITPLNQVWWRIALSYYLMQRADRKAAAEALEQAGALAREYHLHFIESAVLTQRVLLALSFGDLAGADQILTTLEPKINSLRRMDVALFHSAQSWHNLMRGELAAAAKHGQTAVDGAFETGAVTIQSYCLIARAQLLIESGELEHALASARSMRVRGAGASSVLEFDALLIEAYAAMLLEQKDICVAALRTGLRIGRQQGYANTLRWHPKMMSRLLCHALEKGIEVDYAKHLIRIRQLLPEASDSEQWPWPIKFYTLERFAIVIDGTPLKAAGKAQAKPLELLKVLLACGGREVSGAAIIDHIWPDLDGDSAQHAFSMALHRLRKLLRRDDALTVHGGKLSINADIAWVDVWAFERLVNRLDGDAGAEQAEIAEKFFRFYPGNFLQRDTDAGWALPLRERLRNRFLRHAIGFGRRWEGLGNWDGATSAYQRALDVDNVSEELYRALMRCHTQRGENAAAIEAYRRCRQMLSVVLGVRPSAETEAMYRACVGA